MSRLLILLLVFFVLPAPAWAKSGSSVYTDTRQANARANAGEPWSNAASHGAYMNSWLNRGLDQVYALVMHPSLPRAKRPANVSVCPNGKPFRGWYINPEERPFQVKCNDTGAGEWFPKNNFAAHYQRNMDAGGTYLYPAADTTHCDPQNPQHDCGYGATYNGQTHYFVAYYVYRVLLEMARLDLGDPVDGRNLMWSGALISVYHGPGAGDPMARRVAIALYALANHMRGYAQWFPIHLQRDPRLVGFLDGTGGTIFGQMADGLALLNMIRAYDIVYAILADPEVLQSIATLHPERQVSAQHARQHIEENLFWFAADLIPQKTIWGNASLPHNLVMHLAFVLDAGQRSQALLDWVFTAQRGRLPEMFFNSIDRDGGSDEVAAGYTALGYSYHLDTGETLELFGRDQFQLSHTYTIVFADWKRMRYRLTRHFSFMRHLETIPDFFVHLGDEGFTGRRGKAPSPTAAQLTLAYDRFGPDQQLAIQAREANGGTINGLHTTIWDRDPYAVQTSLTRDLRRAPAVTPVETSLAGYGFAQLRGGPSGQEHSVWAYFGRNQSPHGGFGHHGHHDQLDFGIQYAGLDFMPAIGFPSGYGWRYFAWESHAASHNSILVNRHRQTNRIWASDLKTYLNSPGSPVSMMELESDTAYPGVYEWPSTLPKAVLKRTLIRIEIGGGRFFVVEISSAHGSATHHYSYHGGGSAAFSSANMTWTPTGNTYAGVDANATVVFGAPYDFFTVDANCRASTACVESQAHLYRGSGFSFLRNADTAAIPTEPFWVEWNQFDWTQRTMSSARLRSWIVPVGQFDHAALATGEMSAGEPVRYLLLRGQNGTAGSGVINVWEPILTTPAIVDVRVLHRSMLPSGPLAVIEILLADGRKYTLGWDPVGTTGRTLSQLTWTGKLAVYAEDNGAKNFVYLAEGSRLSFGGQTWFSGVRANFSGSVESVRDADGASSFRSRMNVDSNLVANRWVDVQPSKAVSYLLKRDSTYLVHGVTMRGPHAEFDLGPVPIISGLAEPSNYGAGFSYHVNPGDTFRIPLDWWQ
jgi:hypothetical protein